MSDSDNLIYRPCVGIALFNDEGKVFVGERIDNPGAYQMPQGGIDEGEDLKTAALRELEEEIGTAKAEILRVAETPIRYDLPEHMRNRLWNGIFMGQEQIWVAARFTGHPRDIILDAHAKPEFQAYQWVDLARTVDLIVPFKRDVYRQVVELFADLCCELREARGERRVRL
ncbi:MAG: RNA pyrophosphohydrolase [Bdellovibrionales bacterium]